MNEYRANLRRTGQPGVADQFLAWVLTNYRNPNRCELVRISPCGPGDSDFAEFPKDDRLQDFDPSDKKFVAVSLAHSNKPPILQAVDKKWWYYRSALCENGVAVEFLCEKDISAD
jgi:hypothetical protein